jgi:hypothetical protein
MAGGCVFPPRYRGLGAQIAAAVGQATAGQLEAGIAAQVIEIVAVLIAAGDGEDAGTQNVGEAVPDAGRIARVGDQGGQLVGDTAAALTPRRGT